MIRRMMPVNRKTPMGCGMANPSAILLPYLYLHVLLAALVHSALSVNAYHMVPAQAVQA